MRKGRIYLLTSAFIYGTVPVLTKQVTLSGGNGVTLVFLRSALCLPLLFIVLLITKQKLALSKHELRDVFLVSFCGSAPAMVLLYAAYSRSAVGIASMLHFVYPFIIILVCATFFSERISPKKWLGTAIAAAGVLMSLDMKTDTIGAVLAVLSGAFYAFFVIYMDKSGIDSMNFWRLTFYISIGMTAAALVMCIAGDGLQFPTDTKGWLAAGIVSIMSTMVAIPLFQLGVEAEGAAEAGILSMAEPVTSILLGIVLLGESVTIAGAIGCALIGSGIILVEKG